MMMYILRSVCFNNKNDNDDDGDDDPNLKFIELNMPLEKLWCLYTEGVLNLWLN